MLIIYFISFFTKQTVPHSVANTDFQEGGGRAVVANLRYDVDTKETYIHLKSSGGVNFTVLFLDVFLHCNKYSFFLNFIKFI